MAELNLDSIDLGSFGINESEQTQLNANMTEAVKVNPDQHAQTMKLSQQSGVPEFAVKSNPAQVENKLKLDQINLEGMAERAPKTSKFLSNDINNSIIAQEDVTAGLLEGIERTFSGLGKSVAVGFGIQGRGALLSGNENTSSRIDDLIPMGALPMGMEYDAVELSREMASNFGIETDEQLQQAKNEASDRLIGEIQTLQQERQNLTPDDLNILQEGVRAGIESLANMAPGLGLTILSAGRAAPLLVTIGAQTYSGSYGEARADGLTNEEAQWYAGIDAAIEVGTELLPTSTLETIMTGQSTGLKKDALKFVVREMGSEQLATALQTINSYSFGLDKELENAEGIQEIINIQMRRQAVTAIATIVAGGSQIAAATAVNKTISKLTQTEQERQSQGTTEQQNIDSLSADSVNSRLRERDIESFKQFVREADGENDTNVFIDGVQLSLYLQGKTQQEIDADPSLQLLRNAARESRSTGADAAIPVADFMGDIAGTEAFTELREHMTMSEETTSPFRQEQHQIETKAYVETLMNEAQENASEYIEAQEIYTSVRDQLIDTGAVNSANASTMAQIVPAWATAQARRTGRTVAEVYQSAGLTIEGPQTGELDRLEGEQVLNQQPVEVASESESDKVQTGQPMTFNFAHNKDSATAMFGKPKKDSPFERGFEPSGKYMTMVDESFQAFPGQNMEVGKQTFNNPLVIEMTEDGKWKEKLSKQYGGKKGKRLSKAVIAAGYDGIVTKRDGTVSEVVDFTSFDESKALYQAPNDPKNLVVMHNITEKGLRKANELGGLAAPSIAVANVDKGGFDNFGEITLIAKPELLNDKKIRTFDADIYSSRQPRPDEVLNDKKIKQFGKDIDASIEGTKLRSPANSYVNSSSSLDQEGTQFHYLKSIGKEPKVKKTKPNAISKSIVGVSASEQLTNPKFIAAVAKKYKANVKKISDVETDQTFVDEIAKSWFRTSLPEGYVTVEVDGQFEVQDSNGEPVARGRNPSKTGAEYRAAVMLKRDGFVGEIDYSAPLPNILQDELSTARNINEGVDMDSLRDDIRKKISQPKINKDYNNWLESTYDGMIDSQRMFTGYSNAGDRKYKPYTMDNIVKEMNKKLQGGESSNYGTASIRAMYANEMKNVKQVQANRDKFVTSEEMAEIKGEADLKFEEALEELKEYYVGDVDGWGYQSDVAEAIAEGPKGISEAFDGSPEARKIVTRLGVTLASLPTEYFEAKAQRAVQFSEFDTAIVPKGTSKDVIQLLKDNGVKVKTYDKKVEGSRNEIISKQQKLLFQPDASGARGYYDPANSVIRLTESADLSTFLHEFAHFMYEMELNTSTELGDSINNWFKRNGEDVAAEATKYLNKQFDPLKQGELSSDAKLITEEDITSYIDNESTGDTDKDAAIRRATHEQFARGFETYLMEGKAPSVELRNAFRTFARWLSQVYQSLRGKLNVKLDAEMRQVFDRLLATEEQIAAAESRARVEPMFTDAAMAGMTEEEFADYQQRQEKVKDVQSETLRDQLIKAMTRKTKSWWKEEKSDIVDEQMDLLSKEKVYAAATRLKHVTSTIEDKKDIESARSDIGVMEKQIEKLIKSNDTLGKFIAKMGGINRASAAAEGIDPEHFKDKSKVFGKPLFPRSGGLTMDGIAEILNDKGYTHNIGANDALDMVSDMLFDDSALLDQDVAAEIEAIENEIEQMEGAIREVQDYVSSVNLKLDTATVKEMVGETKTDKLGRESRRVPAKLNGMTAKGQAGVHPDEAAAFFGYTSGAEMLNDLVTAPPIKEVAETNAEAEMVQRHGDPFTDGTIERLADEAVANEERGKLVLHELKMLSRGTNQRTLDRQTVKDMARERIGNLSFKEIHPGKYRKAEVRAAQESARMLAEGNKEGAAQAKARQALNYYLGMAATEAKNETTKIIDRMARYNKKKVREEIQKAEGGYWGQITKILERFEFRKSATLKDVDQVNQDINTWAKERMEVDGDGLVLHNVVLNESYVTHWKNVAFSDLQGINDSVKNIEHVARYANKLTRMGEEIEYNNLVAKLVDSAAATGTGRFKKTASTADDVSWAERKGRWAMAQMTKIPYMMSWMDGMERVGTWFNTFSQPMTDAYNDELELFNEVGKPVVDMIMNRSKEDMKRHNTTFFIPEIKDTAGGTHTGNLKGHEILAVALNTGNAGNLKKLLLGEQWATEDSGEISLENDKLQAVLKHMTKSDWQMVQNIWDQIDILYPKLAEVHRRTTGLVPPKVDATPIVNEHGTFRGGYYPVKYDPMRDHKAAEFEERRDAEVGSMFASNASIQSSVNAGSTNERTGYFAPIHLTLNVVPNHIQETIHYITHHDAVREVNRLLRDPRIKRAVTEKLGPEEFAQLKPWLNDIAKDGRNAPTKSIVDAMFNKLRLGTTLGVMGFKASTGIIQISGLSNTIAEVGMQPVLQSMRTILGSPETIKSAWEFAIENSKVLKHRTKTMDREIMNAMQQLESRRGALAAVQETSMKHIAYIQTYMVDLPSWHAAYIKELEKSGDETKAFQYADWVIENVQGSGATKDMAALMRNQTKTHTIFTMFMTFFSALWNLQRDLVKGSKSGAYSTTTVAAKLAFLFVVPVLFEMVMRGEFADDDEDKDLLQTAMIKVALYPVQSIPFVRDVVNGVASGYGYNASPVTSQIEQGLQGLEGMSNAMLEDNEVTKGQAKAVSKLAGIALGVPGTGQAWASGEHLYDVLAEGEDFTTHQLLFGPDKK